MGSGPFGLGCCCGGSVPSIDDPTYYGLCDCGTNDQVLRRDYEQNWNGTIPDVTFFYRPGGYSPNTNPYTDWIYGGRFHITCKPTWNRFWMDPYWSGYESRNWNSTIYKPYGIAGVTGAYNSKPSYFRTQFCWNEFDYEYEWNFCVRSSCKPAFVRSNGGPLGQPSWRPSVEIKFWDSNNSPGPTWDWSIIVTSIAWHTMVGAGQQSTVWKNDLLLVNNFLKPVTNPIKVLQYDRVYNLRKRIKSTATGGIGAPGGMGYLSVEWFLDGVQVLTYSGIAQSLETWTRCTPATISPSYYRLVHCGRISIDGYVDPYSLYTSDPSGGAYVDDFKFNAIKK